MIVSDHDLSERRVHPRNSAERELHNIWAKLLGHRDFGVHDSFFHVGGDSLLAIRMLSHVRRVFGYKLAFEGLLQAPTIGGVAILLRGNATGSGSVLVPIQPRGPRVPLFCFHPIGGSVARFFALAVVLGEEQPMYGLQSAGLTDAARAQDSIEEMARKYVDEIRAVQPLGPYQLLGYSMGGMIAYEAAQQLGKSGEQADVYLVDTPAIDENASEGLTLQAVANYAMRLDIDTAELTDMPFDEVLPRLHAMAIERGTFQQDFPLEWVVSVYQTVAGNLRALAAYEPRPWPGSVVLFHGGQAGGPDSDLGWRALAGELVVYYLGIDHVMLMEAIGVGRIAAFLQNHLRRSAIGQ